MKLEDQVVSLDLAKRLKELEYISKRWKPVPGFIGLYEVSNVGAVRAKRRSGSPGGFLKQHIVRGYLCVWLSKDNKVKKMSVHKLVAMAFFGVQLPHLVVNHIDGNKLNNWFGNLDWCLREENERHKREVLGKDDVGERNGNAKLSLKEVDAIRNAKRRNEMGYTKKLAKFYGVNEQTIRDIWNGKRWSKCSSI